MKKILCQAIAMICLLPFTQSQDFQWSHSTNANDVQSGNFLGVDNMNNIYVGAVGSDKMYVIKYDKNGMLKYYAGDAQTDKFYGMAVSASGRSYLVGDINRGATQHDGLLRVFENDGSQSFVQYYDFMNHNDSFDDIVVDDDGNAYVTGVARDVVDDYAVTIKYSSGGSAEWVQRYGSILDKYHGRIINVNESGDIYVIGNVLVNSTGKYNLFMLNYDSDGNLVGKMQEPFPGYAVVDPTFAVLDDNDNLFVGGALGTGPAQYSGFVCRITETNMDWYEVFTNPADFLRINGGTLDQDGNVVACGVYLDVNSDAYYLKMSMAGTLLYEKRINGPGGGHDMFWDVVSRNEYVYFCGGTTGIGTGIDYYVVKADSDGERIWDERYNGFDNADDVAINIVLDSENDIILTGATDGPNNNQCTTVKYTNSLGIDEASLRENGIEIYTNPVSGELRFDYSILTDNATYEIFDNNGKLVMQGVISNEVHHRIYISKLQKGMYFLRVMDGKMHGTARFINF